MAIETEREIAVAGSSVCKSKMNEDPTAI